MNKWLSLWRIDSIECNTTKDNPHLVTLGDDAQRSSLIFLRAEGETWCPKELAQSGAMPIGTRIALADELPAELDEKYSIVDDRVVSFLERRLDGAFKKETISIIPIDVERMVKRSITSCDMTEDQTMYSPKPMLTQFAVAP